MYKREKIGGLFFMAIFAAFLAFSFSVNARCRPYPIFVCVLGLILTAWNLAVVSYKEKHNIPVESSAPLTKKQLLDMAVTLLAAFAYILLARYIGYFVMTFIYITAFSYYQSQASKKYMYPLVAACMVVVIYIAFKVMLKVPLPSGILF